MRDVWDMVLRSLLFVILMGGSHFGSLEGSCCGHVEARIAIISSEIG